MSFIKWIYTQDINNKWYTKVHRQAGRPPLTIPRLCGTFHSWFIIIPNIAFVSTPQWPGKVVTWAWLTSFEISAPFLSRSQALAVITSAMFLIMEMWPWPWASWCWSHWPWGASSGPRSILLPGPAKQLTLSVLEPWKLTRWEQVGKVQWKQTKLDRGLIRSSPRGCLGTTCIDWLRSSVGLFQHVDKLRGPF